MGGQPEARGGQWDAGQRRTPRGRLPRRIGRALALVLLTWALAGLGAFAGIASFLAPPIASACGMQAGPTMTANGQSALLYPQTSNSKTSKTTSAITGLFPGQFVAKTAITFTEDVSHDPAAPATLQLRWTFGDSKTYTTGTTPAHTYAKAGTYTVQSQLYDSTTKKWTAFDSAAITIIATAPTNPPVAIARVSSPIAQQGQLMTFDATGSHAADNGPLTYLWNFNDGQTSTQAQVQHEFGIAGNGLVALTVTDSQGASSVATITIAVSQTTLASNTTAVKPGGSITFNAETNLGAAGTATTTPTGTATATPKATATATTTSTSITPTYAWNFGDGTPTLNTTTPTTSHTFAKAGHYPVAVQAISGAAVIAVEAVMVTIDPKAGLKPVKGMVQIGSLQVKIWEFYTILGVLVVGIVVGSFSAFRTERRRAAVILAEKAERRAEAARALARATRSRRYDDYDDYDDYNDYDDRGRSHGRGSRHSSRYDDDRDDRGSSRGSSRAGSSGRRARSRDYERDDGRDYGRDYDPDDGYSEHDGGRGGHGHRKGGSGGSHGQHGHRSDRSRDDW